MTFGPGDLPAVRARVIAYANGVSRLDDVVLVVHELAANVVRHGGGHGFLQVWWDDDRIVCRVSDSGPGFSVDTTGGLEPPSPRMSGGRGLWIARRLSDLSIESGPDGTRITAILAVS